MRRKRHVLLVFGGVVGMAIGAGAGSPQPVAADDDPNVVIDDFLGTSVLTTTCDTFAAESVLHAGSIGGEVDLRVACGSGDDTQTGRVSMGGGIVEVEAIDVELTTADLSWDGVDGSPDPGTDGLGGVDLTAQGTKDSIAFLVSTGEPDPMDPTIPVGLLQTFVSSEDALSHIWFQLPSGLTDALITIPFPTFMTLTTDPADFAAAASVGISISDGPTAGPVRITAVETTSLARATLTAALAVDVDGDGRPGPGDVIEYTATVSNPADLGMVSATGAVFSLPTPNGTFVPGSVTTEQGTVTSGNAPTDTGVEVALGDVADGDEIQITFRVEADAVGPLANQGVLTYDVVYNTLMSTRTETDDPSTAAFSDDTITQIVAPVTVSIADAPTVAEGAGPATFTVSLSAASTDPVTVLATTGDGTATSGSDFVARSEVVTIPAGQTSAAFTVDLVDDTEIEGPEAFTVTLSGQSGAILGRATGQATITDDDTAPPSTPAPTTTPPASTVPAPPTTIPAPPTTAPLAPSVPATLPATGSDNTDLAIAAFVVLGLGSVLVTLGRRSARTH